jgi:hypothetical protein
MEKRIQSKIKMLLQCKQYLKNNSNILKQIPAFVEITASLELLIEQINETAAILAANRLARKQKQESINALIALAYSVSCKTHAYACIAGNNILRLESKITPTKLRYCSSLVTLSHAQHIYNNALTNAEALKLYGLSSQMLEELNTTIEQFKYNISEPSLERTLRKTQKDSLQGLIKQALVQLQILDKLVELVRFSEPSFYNGYHSARRIELSMHRLAAIGSVQDIDSGKALSKVHLSIIAEGEKRHVIEQYSAKQGGFRIKSLNESTYQITASLSGYEDYKSSFTIDKSKTLHLDIRMKHL